MGSILSKKGSILNNFDNTPGTGTVTVTSVSFTNKTSVIVNHNLGYKPLVQVLNASGKEIVVDIEHTNTSNFVVSSNVSITGIINYI